MPALTATPHLIRFNLPAGRKMLQTGPVCCLINNGDGSRAQCTQAEPNRQQGNVKQQGLVNVQGVYVNVGCVQVSTQ